LRFQDAIAQGTLTPLRDLFLGNIGGCLGETSAVALLIGGAYLFFRRTIDWRIPVGITFSTVVFTGAFWLANPSRYASPLFHVLAGGFLLGTLFMATDMVTSPVTPKATWIYALGIGLLIGIIRLFSGFPEGVMYAVLFMNTFVPLLNHYLRPRILGERQKA
jgi:electron transport complex protein RnfD